MKFNSKNENYSSLKGNQGIFKNPFVKTVKSEIDVDKSILRVHFALQYIKNDNVNTLELNVIEFTIDHEPTLIEPILGGFPVEIIEFLTNGGTYNPEKVTSWGRPSFNSVQAYFDLDSVWTDLQFADTPFKQLAIDWVMHNVKIEGAPLKEWFEYENPES